MLQTNPIFATYVYSYNATPSDLEVTEEIKNWALELEKTQESTARTNRGGWQKTALRGFTDLHPRAEVFLRDRLCMFEPYKASNWWININRKGAYNMAHTHPLSDLAVVWNLTDNHELLQLHNPHSFSRAKLSNRFNIPAFTNLVANAGDMFVFPSDVLHHVEEMKEEGTRVSLVCNLELL